jgi:hypothetical protein
MSAAISLTGEPSTASKSSNSLIETYSNLNIYDGYLSASTFGITFNAGSTATALNDSFLNQVASSNDLHKVKLPLAQTIGQLKIILNTSGNSVVIRNNADNDTILTLAAGKLALCISTSLGDNWNVSQIS